MNLKPKERGAKREPFVYEGRIRTFDPEPGDVVYLIDHPEATEYDSDANLTHLIENWIGEGMICCGPPKGPFRITVEEIE